MMRAAPSLTAEIVAAELCRRIAPGATLLLHDSDCTSAPDAWWPALGALPLLAHELSERNLRVVTLHDHLCAA